MPPVCRQVLGSLHRAALGGSRRDAVVRCQEWATRLALQYADH